MLQEIDVESTSTLPHNPTTHNPMPHNPASHNHSQDSIEFMNVSFTETNDSLEREAEIDTTTVQKTSSGRILAPDTPKKPKQSSQIGKQFYIKCDINE